MREHLLKRIDELDARQAIRVLEFYAARVFEGMKTSPQEMLDGIPAEFKDRAPFERVLEMSGKERARPLPEADSAVLARYATGMGQSGRNWYRAGPGGYMGSNGNCIGYTAPGGESFLSGC